ncbi:DapH/DapD/GlmU-related protein [Streptomyces sp. NBC_00878]|uniref:acyltransferase n=1 Tax=Streptomyces sp. NBC_00878 TaxID=2975854 RepID=UPI002252B764|nr:acyltransferase [Streptomyces sp. NBC_00878]MCX4911366.1 acyltransferase [Streptomyces sp. NBC_00878]
MNSESSAPEASADDSYFDYCPWDFARRASEEQRAAQAALQQRLADGGASFGPCCYVSPAAGVFTDVLRLGENSYIAGHAYVTGEMTAGADCTVNPYATVRGRIVLGDGVRIGAHSSLLGFNHGFAPDRPVHRQPLTSKGITVGDDVWIGSHVVVLDGVTIGDHCVVGAGAVVTKDLPPWTIAAGNPARPLRDRRGQGPARVRAPEGGLGDAVARFADRARGQAGDLLARNWNADTGRYRDRPGAAETVRAHCDAVEIADLLLHSPPPHLSAAEHAERLRALQDPVSGLVPELASDGGPGVLPAPAADGWIDDGTAEYHVLSVGYALDLLGSRFAHPVHVVRHMTADRLVARLDSLPWRTGAWSAGAWVDCWATGAHRNLELGAEAGAPGALEALFGWLGTRVGPWTGMWGEAASPAAGRLQLVNGYYRLTRGSFAQFGLPVPYAERVVDTVLAHGGDPRWFAADRQNACNVLDVAHPLWLAGQQTRHRAAEARAWAEEQLAQVLERWRDGAGFGFGPPGEGGGGPGRDPGLQGTEMWLAIIWLLADLVGVADRLGYRARGIHRPEAARSAALRIPSHPAPIDNSP